MAKRFTDVRALPVEDGVAVGFRRLGQWQEGVLTVEDAALLGVALLAGAAAHQKWSPLTLDWLEPGSVVGSDRPTLIMGAIEGLVIPWVLDAAQLMALSRLCAEVAAESAQGSARH